MGKKYPYRFFYTFIALCLMVLPGSLFAASDTVSNSNSSTDFGPHTSSFIEKAVNAAGNAINITQDTAKSLVSSYASVVPATINEYKNTGKDVGNALQNVTEGIDVVNRNFEHLGGNISDQVADYGNQTASIFDFFTNFLDLFNPKLPNQPVTPQTVQDPVASLPTPTPTPTAVSTPPPSTVTIVKEVSIAPPTPAKIPTTAYVTRPEFNTAIASLNFQLNKLVNQSNSSDSSTPLITNNNYFYSTGGAGSNSNDGLARSVGQSLSTIQTEIDVIKSSGTGQVTGGVFTTPATFQSSATFQNGVTLASTTPTVTTNTLYNFGGALYWNGTAVSTSTSGGGGITSLNGLAGTSQLFATGSDTNLGLSISSSGSTHTFTPTWTGVLASGRGGTGIGTVTANQLLIGNTAGTGWIQIATSSLGLLTTNVAEGSNLYYTDTRARSSLSTTATGLTYATSTGLLSLTSGYTIPLTASTTEWSNKVSSQWTTNGSNIYYNGGSVGIGTTTPTKLFDVNGSVDELTTNDLIRISNTAGAATGRAGIGFYQSNPAALFDTAQITSSPGSGFSSSTLYFSVADSTKTLQDRMVIDVNGHVGINTNTPQDMLDVEGPVRFGGGTQVSNYITPLGTAIPSKINIPNYNPNDFGQVVAMGIPSTSPGTARVLMLADARTVVHQPTLMVLSPAETQGVGFSWEGGNTKSFVKSSADFGISLGSLTDGGNEDLTILSSSGNVGINSPFPGSTFSVTGRPATSGILDVASSSGASFLKILSTGNVGIGTTNPFDKLDVSSSGSGALGGRIVISNSGTNAANSASELAFKSGTDFSSGYYTGAINVQQTSSSDQSNAMIFRLFGIDATPAGLEKMRITSGGNVGIGTTTPTQGLVVNGNAQFTNVGSATQANDLRITADGILTTNTSDRRLKTNLISFDGTTTLDNVMKLKPYYFNWINDPNGSQDIGLMAQDVAQIYPEITFTNKDGYMGVNYSRLPAILIAAIQQLNNKVDGLLSQKVIYLKDVVADKVTATQVCLGDVCINKDQLKTLLQNNGITSGSAAQNEAPSATPTPTPTSSVTPTPSSTPTPTPSVTASTTPTPSESTTPTPTPTPSHTPTPSSTPTPSATPTPTPTATPTSSPISTPTPSATTTP